MEKNVYIRECVIAEKRRERERERKGERGIYI